MRILDRVQKMELGQPDNRLRCGTTDLAYFDGVLIVENAEVAHMTSRLEPATARIAIYDDWILIDQEYRQSMSLQIRATPAEVAAAVDYFRHHGFTIADQRKALSA